MHSSLFNRNYYDFLARVPDVPGGISGQPDHRRRNRPDTVRNKRSMCQTRSFFELEYQQRARMCSALSWCLRQYSAVSQSGCVWNAEPDRGKQTAVLSCLLKRQGTCDRRSKPRAGQMIWRTSFVQRVEFTAKYRLSLDDRVS